MFARSCKQGIMSTLCGRTWWFGAVTVGCQSCDQEIIGSTPGRVAINWLLLEG